MDASIRDQVRDRGAAIGARIRAARGLRGWSQSDLGAALGVTFQQVQKYEKGTNRFSAAQLATLADALGLEIGFFLPAGASPLGRGETMAIAEALEADATAAGAAADALAALRDSLAETAARLRRAGDAGGAS